VQVPGLGQPRDRAAAVPRRAHAQDPGGARKESAAMTVLYSVDGAVATITLNRPDARNALNDAMCEDLRRIALAVDPAIRLPFVRGNGPVFCAGADVKERAGMSVDQVPPPRLNPFPPYHPLQ